jgi:hypothetical protein
MHQNKFRLAITGLHLSNYICLTLLPRRKICERLFVQKPDSREVQTRGNIWVEQVQELGEERAQQFLGYN